MQLSAATHRQSSGPANGATAQTQASLPRQTQVLKKEKQEDFQM
jgi:hypothetical protein